MPKIDSMHTIVDNPTDAESVSFSIDTVEALTEFGKVLQRIHTRLVKEGVAIEVDDHYERSK